MTYLDLDSLALPVLAHSGFYTPVERRDVLWNRPVRLFCERDILKTACRIDFTF